MPESLYGAHPKKLPVRFKLPSHLDLLRFQHAKVKVGSAVHFYLTAPNFLLFNLRTIFTDGAVLTFGVNNVQEGTVPFVYKMCTVGSVPLCT